MRRVVFLLAAAATLAFPRPARADTTQIVPSAFGYSAGPPQSLLWPRTVPMGIRNYPDPALSRYRNPTMFTAGLMLTAGAATGVLGGGIIVALSCADPPCGFGGVFGGAVMGVGLALGLVGVPLLIVGSRPAINGVATRPSSPAHLAVDARGLALVF